MPSSLLFPLDSIQPSQILSQYSEWIYFGLVLVFFISISGITLRRHFDKPYVKPLIISVGLMLTVGGFMFREQVEVIFQGWGVLGSVLLALVAATIPYGLCRGFGMSKSKAFYLTYILFYLLCWIKFPQLYYSLGDQNLGILNLVLLIIFFIAIIKMVRRRKYLADEATDLKGPSPDTPEIDREIATQNKEKRVLKRQARKSTAIELLTIADIADALAEIQHTVETHKNNLPGEERQRIALLLRTMSKKEDAFKENVSNLQRIFRSIDILDEKQLKDLKERLVKASGSEKRTLQAEVAREEEKVRIEQQALALQNKLGDYLNYFNKLLGQALEPIRAGAYIYDAMPYLSKARVVLKDISDILKKAKALEKRLVKLTKLEKNLLREEKEEA
jgi:hypothetical protein